MFNLNPHEYGSVKYYEHEMKAEKRNLNLVISSAVRSIKNHNLHNEQKAIISDCEAIVLASERYNIAEKRYGESIVKAKESNSNE